MRHGPFGYGGSNAVTAVFVTVFSFLTF